MSEPNDFFSQYLSYVGNSSEVPIFFHRWSAIAGLGAYLGRNFYLSHGHFTVHSNMYCMLIGNPGTRKSTAIKTMRKLLLASGYSTIAADKTTKEKFLMDLAGVDTGLGSGAGGSVDDILNSNLFGDTLNGTPSECFIMADEFNDFFGNGNIEFISLLGTLWDYSGTYSSRVKNSKSLSICDPTISILGGNTPTGFSLAFPPEILGQGFFSRLLLIYGEPSGRKIPFPKPPSPELTATLVRQLQALKVIQVGEAKLSSAAESLLSHIYLTYQGVNDVRFESYSNRRFTHLLKLCLIHAASSASTTIEEAHVIYANTVLHYTEHFMPKALGEFGKAKHSDVSQKIMQVLESPDTRVYSMKEIWKHVHNDLENMAALGDLLRNLVAADKIQGTPGGFLPKRALIKVEEDTSAIDYSFLTEEERTKLT